MERDCKDIQNRILEGKMDEIQTHLTQCNKCRAFYQSLQVISALPVKNIPCPSHLRLEIMKQPLEGNFSNSLYFKWALPVAAVLLLAIGGLFPFHKSGPAYSSLLNSSQIFQEIEELNEEVYSLEDHFLLQDDLIGCEIESLYTSINELQEV
ncbi:MAG: hypothetical protein JW774_06195 [Candidatus Aureabacteria bacterium]|nr:hypothetical protein [Candidatus Auribacterota bacterium]